VGKTKYRYLIALDTNDYGIALAAPDQIRDLLATHLDEVLATLPTLEIFVLNRTYRTGPAINGNSVNSLGFTKEDYWDAIDAACIGKNRTLVVDMSGVFTETDIHPDGVHQNLQGHTKQATFLRNLFNSAPQNTETTAFIQRLSVAPSTAQTAALDQTVSYLKRESLFTGMSEIYPLLTSSLTDASLGIRNQYPLNWTNSVLVTSLGVKGNGGYANTGIIPALLDPTDFHMAIWISELGANPKTQLGSCANDSRGYTLIQVDNSTTYGYIPAPTGGYDGTVTRSFTPGFYLVSRKNNVLCIYVNGQNINASPANTEDVLADSPLLLLALNNTVSGVSNMSDSTVSWVSIGKGLTETQAAEYYSRVQGVQATYSRA
jgi:hypothetical protein